MKSRAKKFLEKLNKVNEVYSGFVPISAEEVLKEFKSFMKKKCHYSDKTLNKDIQMKLYDRIYKDDIFIYCIDMEHSWLYRDKFKEFIEEFKSKYNIKTRYCIYMDYTDRIFFQAKDSLIERLSRRR